LYEYRCANPKNAVLVLGSYSGINIRSW